MENKMLDSCKGNNEKEGRGVSHGKIILMGEHSVVYGYPSIAVPLPDIQAVCRVTGSEDSFVHRSEDPLSTAVYSALKYIDKLNWKIKYDVTSDIPARRGMGSSAAVSIAAVRGVFDYFNIQLQEEVLESLVNEAEIIAHGTPSGLDARTCLSDKAVKFIKGKGFENIDLNLKAELIIADTGIYGNTGEAVGKIRNMGKKASPMLARLGNLTEETEEYIRKKDIINIGRNMVKADEELGKLGITVKKSDLLVKAALDEGAYGAKISGGGLGGCIIALVEKGEISEKIRMKLIKEGAVEVWTTTL